MLCKIKTKIFLFFFSLLGIFIISSHFNVASAQTSCFNDGGKQPPIVNVSPIYGLPSPGDTFTATVMITNYCSYPAGNGYRVGVIWDVNGNMSFFTESNFGMNLAYNIAPGETFTFQHITTIKSGDVCLISGNVRTTGFIENPSTPDDDVSGTVWASTSGAGIGATLNVSVKNPDGSTADGSQVRVNYGTWLSGPSQTFTRLNCTVDNMVEARATIGGLECTASDIARESRGNLCNGQTRSITLTLSCPILTPTPTPSPPPPVGCESDPCPGFVETAPGAWGYCCTSSWCDSGGVRPDACALNVYQCVDGSWQYRNPQCSLEQGGVITYPCTGCSPGVTPPPPPPPPPSECPSGMKKCVGWWECPAGNFCDSSYSPDGSWGCCKPQQPPPGPGSGSTPAYFVFAQVRNESRGEPWQYSPDYIKDEDCGRVPDGRGLNAKEIEYANSNVETWAQPGEMIQYRITVKNMDKSQSGSNQFPGFRMYIPFKEGTFFNWTNPTPYGNILDNTEWLWGGNVVPNEYCEPKNAYACDWWGCCKRDDFIGYAGRGGIGCNGGVESQTFRNYVKAVARGGAKTYVGQAFMDDACWCPGGNPACEGSTCDCTVGCRAKDAITYPGGTCGWVSWQCAIRPISPRLLKVNIGSPVTCQVALSPSSLTVPLGMLGNLSAKVTVSDASVGVQKVDFTIDRPEVASFEPVTDWSSPYSTKITSLAPSGGTPANILGTATLANGATCQSLPTTLTVPTPTCSLSPSPSTLNLIAGDTALLSANVLLSAGGSVNRVTFASQNLSVATVAPSFDNDGSDGYKTTVTGREQGETNLPLTAYLDPGNFAGCNATVPVTVKPPSPWFQVLGGDVHAQGDISTRIPISATPPYFSLELDGYPGVISARGSAQFTPGSVSEKGWQVEREHYDQYSVVNRYDYEYFEKRVSSFASWPETCNPNQPTKSCLEGLADGAYKVEGETILPTPSATWVVGNSGKQKIALFIDGNLTIQGKVRVSTNQSFLAIIVKGNVFINPNVVYESDLTKSAVDGVFIVNSQISTGVSNNPLTLRGSFVAHGGFNLERTSANPAIPAEKFVYDPNLVMEAFQELLQPQFIWEEIAP